MEEKTFMVSYHGGSYPVIGNEGTSLETVWLSQKCWFMKGSEVTITDADGNSRVFVHE